MSEDRKMIEKIWINLKKMEDAIAKHLDSTNGGFAKASEIDKELTNIVKNGVNAGFDKEIIGHGWKGKSYTTDGKKKYEEGSLKWGWDFIFAGRGSSELNFTEDLIKYLKNKPYVFTHEATEYVVSINVERGVINVKENK